MSEETKKGGGRRPDTPERKAEKKELEMMVTAIQQYIIDTTRERMAKDGLVGDFTCNRDQAKEYAIRETYKAIQKKLKKAETTAADAVE